MTGAGHCIDIAFEHFAEGELFQAIEWLLKGATISLDPMLSQEMEGWAEEIGENEEFRYKEGDGDFYGTARRLGIK